MASEYYRVTDWRTRAASLGYSLGVVVLAFVLGQLLLLGVAYAALSAGYIEQPLDNVPPLFMALFTIVQFIGFGLAVYLYVRWQDEYDLIYTESPSLKDLAWIVGGFVAMFLIAVVGGIIAQALGAETATNAVVTEGSASPTLFLYLIPVTILLQAPMEELVFRGVVQGLLRRAYGLAPAILGASLLFGIGHTLALQGSFSGKVNTIILLSGLGVVLGIVYERTDTILVPMAVHGLWNAFLFGSLYLSSSGAISM